MHIFKFVLQFGVFFLDFSEFLFIFVHFRSLTVYFRSISGDFTLISDQFRFICGHFRTVAVSFRSISGSLTVHFRSISGHFRSISDQYPNDEVRAIKDSLNATDLSSRHIAKEDTAVVTNEQTEMSYNDAILQGDPHENNRWTQCDPERKPPGETTEIDHGAAGCNKGTRDGFTNGARCFVGEPASLSRERAQCSNSWTSCEPRGNSIGIKNGNKSRTILASVPSKR